MSSVNFRALVEQLVSDNPTAQLEAKAALLALEEEATGPLSDVYYGGVNDAEGSAILDIVAEIAGFEALALLRNEFHFEDKRPVLRRAAASGLLRNQDNLSPDELEEVTRFLAEFS